VEAKKYARMISMLEELSVNDMEMEVQDIEIMINEMMETEDYAKVMEESVVWLESHMEYLHHHVRVHTPLPGPVTITEKGVELDCVIGLHITGGHDDRVQPVLEEAKPQLEVVDGGIDGQLSDNIDWSRVGGV
jgi:hypothetical protein